MLLVWAVFSGFFLVVGSIRLSHDLLEAVSLYELDTIVLIDFVDRNALVLQSEEEVDEFADLVRVVGLLLLNLFQLPLLVLKLHEQVQFFLRDVVFKVHVSLRTLRLPVLRVAPLILLGVLQRQLVLLLLYLGELRLEVLDFLVLILQFLGLLLDSRLRLS